MLYFVTTPAKSYQNGNAVCDDLQDGFSLTIFELGMAAARFTGTVGAYPWTEIFCAFSEAKVDLVLSPKAVPGDVSLYLGLKPIAEVTGNTIDLAKAWQRDIFQDVRLLLPIAPLTLRSCCNISP